MPNDGDRSVSVTSHHFVVEPPPQIDVRRSYGAISVDEFTKQHAIGYLGLPFEWDDDDQGWIVAVRAEHLKLMAQFLDDLEAMDYGEDIDPWLYVDASAAIGVAQRTGLGKIRHLETGSLWLQEAVKKKQVGIAKVKGTLFLVREMKGIPIPRNMLLFGMD